MRFETKFDAWVVVVLVAGAVFTLGLPWICRGAAFWLDYLTWPLWAYVLLSTLPQYYEVRPDGLLIRQGDLRKVLITAS